MRCPRAVRAPRQITLLYGGGLRIAEACGLRWRDLTEREDGGQATLYGKGGKTRAGPHRCCFHDAVHLALRERPFYPRAKHTGSSA